MPDSATVDTQPPATPDGDAERRGPDLDRVINVLMVGVGGQGIVLASDILSDAAIQAGYDVKKSEIHGMSQRGGPVFSHVRFGPKVDSPVISTGEADVIYALERMELLRWAGHARKGATAVYVEQDMLPAGVDAYPVGLDEQIARLFDRVVRVDSKALRGKVSPKTKNTVLLGALSVFLPLPAAAYTEGLETLTPSGTGPVNRQAFELGRELAQAQLTAGAPAGAGDAVMHDCSKGASDVE